MGELVEAAKALSAPATKLIEVVSRGIGRAYDPRYKRKMADAAAYEIDTIAGAIRRNGDVPILFDREGVQLDARSAQDLIERTGMRLFSQEVRKQQNIESIVDKAYEELKNQDTVSNEPVDDDWIVRFFNSVEDVSNEKLQEIWARILAGEIKKPRGFPFRTLEVLRNLSLTEAEVIERVAFCFVSNGNRVFIPYEQDLMNEFHIEYQDLITLWESGLLNLSSMSLTLNIDESNGVIYNKQIVGILEQNKENLCDRVMLKILSLTDSGRDISKVVSQDNDKCKNFALKYLAFLKRNHGDCITHAYRYIGISEKFVHHDTTDLLLDF